jgi:hypothetical protein
MNAPLDLRVRRLAPGLDADVRRELATQLNTLRREGNHVAVLSVMSRLCLRLLRRVYADLGAEPPSDNLYHLLAHLSSGDPALKLKGLHALPKEIASLTHSIRTWSNVADHAAEQARLTPSDAERALGDYLRLVEWYYVEFDKGPGWRASTPPPHAGASGRRPPAPACWRPSPPSRSGSGPRPPRRRPIPGRPGRRRPARCGTSATCSAAAPRRPPPGRRPG